MRSNFHILLLLMLPLLFQSCMKGSYLGPEDKPESTAIGFATGRQRPTKATATGAEAATLLGNHFIVSGVKYQGSFTSSPLTVFEKFNVNYTDGEWKYDGYQSESKELQHTKFWDRSAHAYRFVAVSGQGITIDGQMDMSKIGSTSDPVFTIKGTPANLVGSYVSRLETIKRTDAEFEKPVRLNFSTAGAAVRIGLYETISGYKVNDISFYDVETKAAKAFINAPSPVFAAGSEESSLKVYYPEGSDKAQFEFVANASESYKRSLELNALNYTDKIGENRVEASYTGSYTNVVPQTFSSDLSVKFDYKLVSTDGSLEEISRQGLVATIPQELAKWQGNYQYTYLFRISPASTELNYIEFDAVVVNSPDGFQETISTVTMPTISIFAKNGSTGAGDFRLDDDGHLNLYIAVKEPYAESSPTNVVLTHDNLHIYSVWSSAGALENLNGENAHDALDGDALHEGGEFVDTEGKRLVFTHVDDSRFKVGLTTIPGSETIDGSPIQINCARVPVDRAQCFILRYDSADKTHFPNPVYLIVRVWDKDVDGTFGLGNMVGGEL